MSPACVVCGKECQRKICGESCRKIRQREQVRAYQARPEVKVRKAEHDREYQRKFRPKKRVGYGHKPGKRADRFIDKSRSLPSEDVILRYWSHADILVELSRLDKEIARCRAGNEEME
jgi:hypothetical protein